MIERVNRFVSRLAVGAAFVGMVLFGGDPAAAAGSACCSDGKPASASAQKAACKKTSGATLTACKKLAKLPDWWINIDGTNYHRPNGVAIIKSIRGQEPYKYWRVDFARATQEYKDNHGHING